MTQPMYRAGPDARVAYPHLGDCLRRVSNHIRDVWVAAVRRELPGADESTFARLRDEVPRAFSILADVVSGGVSGPGTETNAADTNAAPEDSTPPSFRIDEAVIELGLLRRTVFEVLPLQMGQRLMGNEVVVVNEYLDSMVNRAVAAHREAQARQAREANAAQSKYLSFVSHDLRGGLNGIFLMVEVLRRELTGRPELAESLEDLEMMRRSILETVATMDRFLYAERFRKGEVRLRLATVSLRALVVEIGSRFTHAAKDQGIELKIDAADRADIVTDRELLGLILHGLVANAVKHTRRGTVTVCVKPRETGTGWRVEVGDSGSGIDAEMLAGIHAGFQEPVPCKTGPGMGLSLASQAARRIGATLDADSAVGAGSRFWVDLPEKGKAG